MFHHTPSRYRDAESCCIGCTAAHCSLLFLLICRWQHTVYTWLPHTTPRQVTPTIPSLKPYSLWQASPKCSVVLFHLTKDTSRVCVMHGAEAGSQLTCRGVTRCLPTRCGKCTIGRRRRGLIIKQLVGSTEAWQSTSHREEKSSTHELLISVAVWTDLPFDGGKKNVTEKNTKQNTDSLFLWFICWFIPRCEYDSMFVQDDVILNVGFFFFLKAFIPDSSMHYYYY